MEQKEKSLIEMLGEFVIVENIRESEIKNILYGEINLNNRKIKTYVIGNNLTVEQRKIEGKIVSLIELNKNEEERFVVYNNYNNEELWNLYAEITGTFRDVEELKNSKIKCLYEKSSGAIIYKITNCEPYFLVIYSKKNFSGFPKGHVEIGETEEDAAKREIQEEVGINIELKPDFKSSITYNVYDTPIQKKVVFFLAEVQEDTEININPNEISKFDIVNYNQAKEILNDELMGILNKAKKYIEKN
ncbi:MAG: NUDIX domain-containing protein [Clostridia bacterium]|nr:NUDIX domain-containing protein [Clostridia bacterium]